MEDHIVVVASLGQGRKVLAGLWGMVMVELDRYNALKQVVNE
jgi:hypothetical protein